MIEVYEARIEPRKEPYAGADADWKGSSAASEATTQLENNR